MNKLSRHEVLSLGITVFSMFFGAGNLIFPSMIGYLSGYNLPISIFFFSMSAVFLTFLGISAVAKAEGFYPIGSKVHPYFATAFTVIIYISIGPGLAIPRAGTMPFEIAIKPILSESNLNVGMLIYTFVFFGIAAWLSMKPNKLVDRMGKVLTPILLSLLIITSVLIFF
ncbi:branched-chain amino acid transport system II carrier protein [Erysipelothrix rhusiopathiae]|nr:branched-chain amino acid transport system II carrier protein [Erysipelothrix rhusiopathiae]MDE8295079.1 branched-chain amino acid transport system II carrier protein [Erysipelothrix rhusiopathiae]